MLTLEQAKTLRPGQTLYSTMNKNADGSPQRWRVNGAVKTWKTDARRIRVPLKFGLYSYDVIDETVFVNDVCNLLSLSEEYAATQLTRR
jgi:hypothetical protein